MVPTRLKRAAAFLVFVLWVSTSAVASAQSDRLLIGQVQGSVSEDASGTAHQSPYKGSVVTVSGVIYQTTVARTSRGTSDHGFFIQEPSSAGDGDPNTSDGLFVYIGRFSTLRRDGGGYYTPRVGDEVTLRGPVVEYFNFTELSNPYLVSVDRVGVDIPSEVAPFVTQPPDALADANRYWERREGMRAALPEGAAAVSGRDVFSGTRDAEAWFIHPSHEVALRPTQYEDRVFRDPHPLDNKPDQTFDDANGYRIAVGSHGLKTASANETIIAPVRTFDRLGNSPSGGVYYSFGKYQVMVDQQLELLAGENPDQNAAPADLDEQSWYSVATFNVENLYDYRDDPTDGCDFTGNAGCPGVRPPFDYVPRSQSEYDARLAMLATQIADDLHGPEIILVQEAEDQDICRPAGSSLSCGGAGDSDGRPDTLQELALVLDARGGPRYHAAYDRDGADDRGIVSAFLYRADSVELLPPTDRDVVLGSEPKVEYRGESFAYNADVQNPKALNADLPGDVDRSTGRDGEAVFTRPPQIGLFRIWRDGIDTSVFRDAVMVSNHFSSIPDRRVGQRREQASYNAAIFKAIQRDGLVDHVVVGGDLNVYPRPDDPLAPGAVGFPSDQLGPLYGTGLSNLYDRLLAEEPASAYSYVYQGQAQTLDHLFVNDTLLSDLGVMRAAHVNADWAKESEGDAARGVSDHDPQIGAFSERPTVGLLIDLVRYFSATSQISSSRTEEILVDRLERARRLRGEGKEDAYREQIRAFIEQVKEFTPRSITPSASDALVGEAEWLL